MLLLGGILRAASAKISHDVDNQSADSAEGIPPTDFLIAMVSS